MKDPNALTFPPKYCNWRDNPRDNMTVHEKLMHGDLHLTNAEFEAMEARRIAFMKAHGFEDEPCGCCVICTKKSLD